MIGDYRVWEAILTVLCPIFDDVDALFKTAPTGFSFGASSISVARMRKSVKWRGKFTKKTKNVTFFVTYYPIKTLYSDRWTFFRENVPFFVTVPNLKRFNG